MVSNVFRAIEVARKNNHYFAVTFAKYKEVDQLYFEAEVAIATGSHLSPGTTAFTLIFEDGDPQRRIYGVLSSLENIVEIVDVVSFERKIEGIQLVLVRYASSVGIASYRYRWQNKAQYNCSPPGFIDDMLEDYLNSL